MEMKIGETNGPIALKESWKKIVKKIKALIYYSKSNHT